LAQCIPPNFRGAQATECLGKMNRNHKDKKDKKDKKGVKVSTFGYLFLILAILTKNGPGEATVGISNMKN
jgi:hypothetical protein